MWLPQRFKGVIGSLTGNWLMPYAILLANHSDA
ncbi:hypothetical protein T4C_13066 [Trichinella pseudospiralis]|uniref:Uncharacterized protein n=1 Tax=Trichinella pseudospiralis TaxID=6337 RepID=A0A0V1GD74_TRIPS|nr:hypothetical protein T4C_13066 [Trichinella pseudospiralis]